MFGKEREDRIESLLREILGALNPRKAVQRKHASGYITVEDLLPSYGREKVFSPDDALVITVNTVIDFSGGLAQTILDPNPNRCFVFIQSATAGPFYISYGDAPAVATGVIIPSQYSNFERHSKTHWLYKGAWNCLASSAADKLVVIEGSTPGINRDGGPDFQGNQTGDADGGNRQSEF